MHQLSSINDEVLVGAELVSVALTWLVTGPLGISFLFRHKDAVPDAETTRIVMRTGLQRAALLQCVHRHQGFSKRALRLGSQRLPADFQRVAVEVDGIVRVRCEQQQTLRRRLSEHNAWPVIAIVRKPINTQAVE